MSTTAINFEGGLLPTPSAYLEINVNLIVVKIGGQESQGLWIRGISIRYRNESGRVGSLTALGKNKTCCHDLICIYIILICR
jgi:hypothetical protein